MNKIQSLIAQHCPNGVEYRKLGELIKYEQPTKFIVKSTEYDDSYAIPVLTAGDSFILGYTNENEGIYEATKENPVIIFDDFTTSMHWVDFSFKVKSSAMKMLTPKEGASFKYLYYAMKSIKYQPKEHARQWISNYSNIPIPLPPIPVQEEIVRILDAFTELQTELQTELELRKKQYQYYRDKLLVQDYPNGVEWRKLGEISTIKTGKSNAQDAVVNGIYPLFDRSQTIKRSNRFLFDDEVIIVAGEGNFTPKYFNGKFDLHQRAYAIYKIKQAIPKFVFYAILSNQKYFKRVAVDSTVISLRVKHLEDFPIPLPPLEEQKRIVEILDRFDKLVNDITNGIPAEIEMRKKQYEYYRDRLLSFERVC